MNTLPLLTCLRTGVWLTPKRLRVYPVLFLVILLAGTPAAVTFRQGVLDPSGKFLGTDFICFWSASHLLWQGRPEAAYDLEIIQTVPESFFPVEGPLYPWMYPPMAWWPMPRDGGRPGSSGCCSCSAPIQPSPFSPPWPRPSPMASMT